MGEPVRYLDVIQHENPCTEDWDAMDGDGWVRHCPKCAQSVYNLSAMTAGEAERLMRERNGNVCTKLYRRPDGSVLTQRCPSSVRKAWGRVLRLAAAVGMAAAPGFGHEGCTRGHSTVTREDRAPGAAALRGRVRDITGASIPGARVSMVYDSGPPVVEMTDVNGDFSFAGISDGMLQLVVEYDGFYPYHRNALKIVPGQTTILAVALEIGATIGEVVYVDRPAPPVRAVGRFFRWIGSAF